MANPAEATGRRGMKLHDPAGTLIALGFIAFGAVLIGSTSTMTPLGSVFPITISVAMIVFSVILVLRNIVIGLRMGRGVGAVSPPEATDGSGGSMPRRIAFLVLMVAWVVLIPVLGFFAASVLSFFAIMAVAIHERLPAKEIVILVVIGFAILAGFYLLMANVLLIPMPRGLLF